jgi:hypothetical protein
LKVAERQPFFIKSKMESGKSKVKGKYISHKGAKLIFKLKVENRK